jgi:hypothetical protein
MDQSGDGTSELPADFVLSDNTNIRTTEPPDNGRTNECAQIAVDFVLLYW